MIGKMVTMWIRRLHEDATTGFQFFVLCRQASTLLAGIILAKSQLSVLEIGAYEMWWYLGLFFTLFFISGALQGWAAQEPKWSRYQQGHSVFNVALVILIFSVFLGGLLWLGQAWWIQYVFQLEKIPFLNEALVFLVLHFAAGPLPNILLVKKKASYLAPLGLLYLILFIGLLSGPLLMDMGLQGVVHGLIGFGALETMVLWIMIVRSSLWRLDVSLMRTWILQSLPLILYGGVGVLAPLFDAWLVNFTYRDLSVFAIFRYGARELPGSLAVAGAFTTAMVFLVARSEPGYLDRIRGGTRRWMHLFFGTAIALMIISNYLFGWVYSAEFIPSVIIFDTYLLLTLSRWCFPHAVIMGFGEHRILLIVAALELIVNISLSLILIRWMGLVGVALATVVAYMIEKGILAFWLERRHAIALSSYFPIRLWLIYGSLLILIYGIKYIKPLISSL